MIGSTDETKSVVDTFIKEATFKIRYYYQENQGKMVSINNLVDNADGELLIECDSDDYLRNNAVKVISSKYQEIKDKKDIYAMVFLKYNENECNIGNTFKDEANESTMFDLYFKDGLTGDKALVYITELRKKYKYKLEKSEKFSTEARMHNEMDKKYKVVCFNQPVLICKYLEEGYSKNIKEIFKDNPYGYFEYFKQLLSFDMKNVLLKKRLYIIKHYILFSYLTNQKSILKSTNDLFNKILIIILYVPGILKSYIKFK